MALAVQASRFALLQIDDDTDSDEKSNKSKASSKKDTQQSTSARKRNKKKKKNLEKLENDEVCKLGWHIIALASAGFVTLLKNRTHVQPIFS